MIKKQEKKIRDQYPLKKNFCGQNTEKNLSWQDFFSKNRFFGQITKLIVLKPYYIDRTSSSVQFPYLSTKFDLSSKKLQPNQKSFKKVKKLPKNWATFKIIKLLVWSTKSVFTKFLIVLEMIRKYFQRDLSRI